MEVNGSLPVTRTETVEIGASELILAIKVETVGESPCKVYFIIYQLEPPALKTSSPVLIEEDITISEAPIAIFDSSPRKTITKTRVVNNSDSVS